MLTVKLGDTIGMINKVLFNMKDDRTNYWKLSEGKVKSITLNRKGRRVKADHFYTLDADEIESNTKWMLDTERLILTCEPFILTDELRERVTRWIEDENRRNSDGRKADSVQHGDGQGNPGGQEDADTAADQSPCSV